MLKFALVLLSMLSIQSAFAAPITLDTLDCGAYNGGRLRALRSVDGGAEIDARFGMVQQTYLGRILKLNDRSASIFELVDQNGRRAMTVSAVINPRLRGLQTVSATISAGFFGSVGARCEIRVTDIP